MTAVQVDPDSGAVLRVLSPDLLGWPGMTDFVHVSVVDSVGNVVVRRAWTICINSYERARITDEGPLTQVYPGLCGSNPFTLGVVWGIEEGWAVRIPPDSGFAFHAPENEYTLHASIDPAWVDALDLQPAAASTSVKIEIQDRQVQGRNGQVSRGRAEQSPRVATLTSPVAESLPDLVALPAWDIGIAHRHGRDYLTFSATEWNGGSGPLVVEGFREPDEPLMEAYQYLLIDGEPVGRAPIGQLEFHPQHQHWHFQQFTEYTLLDAHSGQVAVSGKRSWCLADTDAIDLTLPDANWAVFGSDVFTMCGDAGALWIREVLDVGWGDTYEQTIAGQAFNVTDLPNGEYVIRVQVNPTGSMYEGSTDNNVEDRTISLRGRAGHRRVIVSPWRGIEA